MKLKLLSFVLASGVLISSCKKSDTVDQVENKAIDQITAPSTFMWSGSRDVSLSIGISDNAFGNQIHVIRVYNADPAKGGELVTTGSATLITPFNTKFTLPSTIKEVFIQKVAPSGSVVSQTLALTSDNLSASISATGISTAVGKLAYTFNKGISAVAETAPSVPAGATVVPNGSNYFNTTANTIYRVNAGSNLSFNDPAANVTIYITGTGVTISALKLQNNLTVIVAAGASVNFSQNFNWDGAATFKNFGTVTANTNFKVNSGSTFRNQGPLTVNNGSFTVSNNVTSFINMNTITVSGNSDIDSPIENDGTITLNGTNEFKGGSNFTNNAGATLAFGNSTQSISGRLTNSGAVTFAGSQINMNSSTSLVVVNSGTFTALNAKMDLTGTFTNTGTVRIKNLEENSGGTINNNCSWYVSENAIINAPINNYSFFKVGGSINVNGGGTITLFNGAFFRTGTIQALNVDVIGSGTTSLFKADGNIDANLINNANNNNSGANSKFSGALQVDLSTNSYPLNATQPQQNNSSYPAWVNGLPVGFFKNGAVRMLSSNAVYIPTSNCMAEGNGTAPVNNDTDGDGVPNASDAYPNDPNKAYIIYSENYVNGGSTVAFEDSWPLKGDYDLNDVVINYKYKIITNAQNKVVRVEADYKLLATGGEFQNGAGIEFPINANQVSNFSGIAGTSLESGQAKAVVILFQNSRAEQATWNTQTAQSVSPAKEYAIAFDVVNGPDQANFGVSNFNPFIWNGSAGFGRGYETHLFGKTPTSKANTALFKTGNDDTTPSAGKYYGTSTNLPWAITLPIANFKYPLERMPITDGYLKFSNWATSGGASSQDWYSNTASGYRVLTNLY